MINTYVKNVNMFGEVRNCSYICGVKKIDRYKKRVLTYKKLTLLLKKGVCMNKLFFSIFCSICVS